MIKTFISAESMTLTDFRLRRWFSKITDAEKQGWRLVSAKLIPGWIVDYYTAQLNRNPGIDVYCYLGPVEDRIPSRGGCFVVPFGDRLMALTLTDVQQVDLVVKPVNKAGNEAPVEGVEWASSDPSVIEVVVDAANSLKALVKTTGKVGNAQVKFSCDARIGEGVSSLIATLDVQVVPGEAINVEINAGTPSDRA